MRYSVGIWQTDSVVCLVIEICSTYSGSLLKMRQYLADEVIFGVFDIKFCSSVDNEKFTVKIGSFLSKENRLGVESSYHRGLHYFVLMTTCATPLLIIAGALVTSNDAGLSVPDWPLSFGQLMPEMSGGVFYEHSHRMVAVSVLSLIHI